MDSNTRQVIINKLGTLMFANSELAAENAALRHANGEHQKHIDMLKAELARWQQDAQKAAEAPQLPLDRPDGVTENIPANPYAENGKVH